MLLNIILKSILTYFIIMIALKFMGKREIGQLSLFDFAIILIIANIIVIGVEEGDHPFYYYIIPIFILSVIQKVFAFLVMKFVGLRKLVDGVESVIIYDGKLNIKEMKKIKYNMDDLILQLRLKNAYMIKNIRYAFLESNGQISVIFDEKKNSYVDEYPFALIVSGKIVEKNLKYAQVSKEWLIERLNKKSYKEEDIKDLIYVCKDNDDIFILETVDLEK